VPSCSRSSGHTLLVLLDPAKKGTTILQNISNYLQLTWCNSPEDLNLYLWGQAVLLFPEDEGTMILQNIDNYVPGGMA
jgi:hypothetical protein